MFLPDAGTSSSVINAKSVASFIVGVLLAPVWTSAVLTAYTEKHFSGTRFVAYGMEYTMAVHANYDQRYLDLVQPYSVVQLHRNLS
jgi:hypothetical protein